VIDYTVLAAEEKVLRTADAIRARGIEVEIVETGADALAQITRMIPAGAGVMTGASQTLREIGLEDMLISKAHSWVNLKDELLAEQDMGKQMYLRRQSTLAEYYLGSVQAIAETGELVFASATGSQLPAYAYSSPNLIWVAGIQKIVPTLDEAIQRVRDYCFTQEDAKMKALGYPGSLLAKLLILEHETPYNQRTAKLILVNEPVGV
jgi:hypothetical protein